MRMRYLTGVVNHITGDNRGLAIRLDMHTHMPGGMSRVGCNDTSAVTW